MHPPKSQPVTIRDVWKTWYPLALSWLMMGIELPLLSAVVARLANPEVNLGAYGGVVFPLALLIEAPIIMLLTASTKLSRDLASYKKLWRFMMLAGGGLSALHLLVAVTPLFDWLAGGLPGVEGDILEASTLSLEPAGRPRTTSRRSRMSPQRFPPPSRPARSPRFPSALRS
ncbi:MAG: hypothetical protein H8E20_01145, partial [Verrucomicrobia bacterium]|nr:hypothetical protein [Verrucomicrobiota bacterium]